jgi:hypothetical protein
MPFSRRARILAVILAGLYSFVGIGLFMWHRMHPSWRGSGLIMLAAPWSGLIRTSMGMLIGLALNSVLIFFVAAGMYMAIDPESE